MLAYYKLQNREDAEDVVSEAVFDMYKGISKLKDLSAYRAWAMKILSVKCSLKLKEYCQNKTEDIEAVDIRSDVPDMGLWTRKHRYITPLC